MRGTVLYRASSFASVFMYLKGMTYIVSRTSLYNMRKNYTTAFMDHAYSISQDTTLPSLHTPAVKEFMVITKKTTVYDSKISTTLLQVMSS